MAKGLKIVGAFVLAALCWEILLTFVDERNSGYLKSDKLGIVAQQGSIFEGKEGFSITHINSSHFRGAEFDKNDASKHRVMVLGDSYTLAAQVDEASSYVRVAESLFAQNGRADVQLLNTGQFGKGPAYYLHYGKGWAEALAPEFTVVQLNEGDFKSDFSDKSRDAYAEAFESGYRVKQNPKEPDKLRSLLTKSTVINITAVKAEEFLKSRKPQRKTSQEPPSYDRQTQWFMQELKATFPKTAIVYIPTMDYHAPETLGVAPALEVSIERAAQAQGIPFLNMRSRYAQYYRETKQPCHGFNNSIPGEGHINGYGHRLLGEELYKLIGSRIP